MNTLVGKRRAVGDELANLVTKLPRVEYLGLGSSATGRTLKILADSPSLSHLFIAYCDLLTAEDFKYFKDIPSLRHLDFTQATFDQHHLTRLAGIPNLKILGLRSQLESVSGFEALRRVEELQFSRCNLSQLDLSPLEKMPALKVLVLNYVQLTAAQVEELSELLPEIEIQSEHGIFNEHPSQSAAEKQVAVFQNERNVASWILERGGKVKVTGAEHELTSVKDLPKSNFKITQVTLDNIDDLQDEELWRLEKLTSVAQASFANTPIDGSGLAYINQWQTLTDLNLGNCPNLQPANLNYLSPIKSLRNLDLEGTASGDETVQLKGHLSSLTCIKLGSRTTGNTLRSLANTNLTALGFFDCPLLETKDFRHLAKFSDLSELYVNDPSPELMEHIASIPKLRVLGISTKSVNAAFSKFLAFEKLKTVRELSFTSIDLRHCDLCKICEMDSLKRLDLKDCQLSEEQLDNLYRTMPNVEINH